MSNTATQPRLLLICGLVGAGKTTLARKLAEEIPAVRLCPDEWLMDLGVDLHDEKLRERLEARFKQLAYELLKQGQDVVLEFGFWARPERDEIREAAHNIGASVELYYLEVPHDELVRRVEKRNNSDMWQSAPISREQMDHFRKLFQEPSEEELNLFDSHQVVS
jgi:predicted kinase